jgi:uncharacterized protein
MSNLIPKIEEEVKEIFLDINGCHDFDHTIRVVRIAVHLAKIEKADVEIVNLAALLHDIGRQEQDKSGGKICHAQIGAQKAEKILKKYKLNEEKIAAVKHCIASHRFRKDNKPKTVEAKILFDADKLDSIGAIGIGRAFAFSGEINARVHNDEIVPSTENEYTKDDTAHNEFTIKLKYIKNKMLTKSGQAIANHRHKFMVDFFEELQNETSGKI